MPRPGGRAATFGIERQAAIGPEFDGQVRSVGDHWDRWDAGKSPKSMGFVGGFFQLTRWVCLKMGYTPNEIAI